MKAGAVASARRTSEAVWEAAAGATGAAGWRKRAGESAAAAQPRKRARNEAPWWRRRRRRRWRRRRRPRRRRRRRQRSLQQRAPALACGARVFASFRQSSDSVRTPRGGGARRGDWRRNRAPTGGRRAARSGQRASARSKSSRGRAQHAPGAVRLTAPPSATAARKQTSTKKAEDRGPGGAPRPRRVIARTRGLRAARAARAEVGTARGGGWSRLPGQRGARARPGGALINRGPTGAARAEKHSRPRLLGLSFGGHTRCAGCAGFERPRRRW